jgi:hypothetical protein
MTRRFRRVLALLVLTGAAGCELPAEPRMERRVVGFLEWPPGPPPLTIAADALPWDPYPHEPLAAPDTVDRDVPFAVRVTTLGREGCWRQGGAEVRQDEASAVIIPYDLARSGPDGYPLSCAGALVQIPRLVHLHFSSSGEAVVWVHGRRALNGDPRTAVPLALEKRIVVR